MARVPRRVIGSTCRMTAFRLVRTCPCHRSSRVVQSGAMPVRCLVRPGSYFDSVVLMRIAAELGSRPGVRAASLVMATAPNKDVLAAAGLLAGDAAAAGANDLVVAIDTDDDGADETLAAAEAALS